jgi:ABC-type glutathione transport system ATPase component
MTGPVMVRVQNVTKMYGGNPPLRAVDDVSVEIHDGETLGLVGESGSGKSTLSRMILGLERPTHGSVFVGDRNVSIGSTRELRAIRRETQIVFQDPVGSLNRRKTVEESIAAPMEIYGVPKAERRKRVREVLELVGLSETHARRYPSALSGGQCQRVGIARALAVRPKLVILDEAVSALDVSTRAQILNLLRDLQATLGVTYLFISHDFAIVRYMSRRIAVMYRGKIVEEQARDDLFNTPTHEYTRELMSAIPRLEASQGA